MKKIIKNTRILLSLGLAALILCLSLTGCNSEKDGVPASYVGTYTNIVYGSSIKVSSTGATLKGVVITNYRYDGIDQDYMIVNTNGETAFDYSSNKKFHTYQEMDYYGTESGRRKIYIQGFFQKKYGVSITVYGYGNPSEVSGITLDYIG